MEGERNSGEEKKLNCMRDFNIMLALEDIDAKSILCPCKNPFQCACGALPETHFDVTVPLIFCHTRELLDQGFSEIIFIQAPRELCQLPVS